MKYWGKKVCWSQQTIQNSQNSSSLENIAELSLHLGDRIPDFREMIDRVGTEHVDHDFSI